MGTHMPVTLHMYRQWTQTALHMRDTALRAAFEAQTEPRGPPGCGGCTVK